MHYDLFHSAELQYLAFKPKLWLSFLRLPGLLASQTVSTCMVIAPSVTFSVKDQLGRVIGVHINSFPQASTVFFNDGKENILLGHDPSSSIFDGEGTHMHQLFNR